MAAKMMSMTASNATQLVEQYAVDDFNHHRSLAFDGISDLESNLFSRLDPSGKTLEIGCAQGRISFGLEKQLNFTDIIAIDLVERFIDSARILGAERGSRVRFELGDVTELHYDGGAFDQIVCWGVVLSHLIDEKDRRAALSETLRILKPGGRLVINAHNLRCGGIVRVARVLTSVIRFFNNPKRYGPQVFPRLGVGGRPDPFFWRSGKAQIYVYDPAELVHDLLAAGYVLDFLRNSAQAEAEDFGASSSYDAGGYGIYAIARKP
jgi:2-polyprenyl-3-methyl-5-hydroxy-6-metoxy-1,4-benzoquinol methylase